MATSYTGLRVQDTYNAIIKIGDNSNLTATPKLLSDGLGNDSPLYLSGTRLGIGISPAYQFHTSGNAKIGGDVIISGDLTVNGDLTYLNVTDLAVEDPLIKLAKDNTANTLDIGLFGKYVATGTKYKGFFNDASDDKFKLFIGTTVEPTTTVDISASGYTVGTLVANLEGNVTGGTISGTTGTFSGDITIAKTDPIIRLYDNSGANTDPNGKIIFSEVANTSNFEISYNGLNDRLEFNGLVSGVLTDLVRINRNTTTPLNVLGGATFADDVEALSFRMNSNYSASAEYLIIHKMQNQDGGIILRSKPSGDSGQNDWQIVNHSSTGDLRFYAYGLAGFALTLDRENGNATFAGQVTIPETPTADAHAASKKYVDDNLTPQSLSNVLGVGNTSGANDIIMADDQKVSFGNDEDLSIEYNSEGDFGRINNKSGHLYIQNSADNRDIIFRSDDGAGGLSTYFQLDGGESMTKVFSTMRFSDDVQLRLGTSSDLRIYHDDTNSIIQNFTGNLEIKQSADDKDIIFYGDDGSGGITEYFRVDGSTNTIPFGRSPHIVDNVKLYFGNDTANDASIKWDSTASELFIDGESKFLDNLAVVGAIKDSDGDAGTSGQVLSSTGTGTNWIDLVADVAKRIDVTVKNVSGGSLAKGTVVHAAPTATPPSGNVIEVIAADANNAAKMPAIGVLNETIADEVEGEAVMFGAVSGIDTSGFSVGDELYVSETAGEFTATKPTAYTSQVQKIAVVIKSHASNGLIKVFGAGRANDVPNRVDRNMNFTDDSELSFGTDSDLQIYHDDTNALIFNDTGHLILRNSADDKDIIFQCDNGSGGVAEYFRVDGSTNTIPFGRSPHIVDNVKLYFGNDTANDASIRWDSTASQLFIDGTSKFLDNVISVGDIETTNGVIDIYKFTDTSSSATGTTLLSLTNNVGTSSVAGDLSQQKTFIDFNLLDGNDNEFPQVRIGAEVGQNGDANSQILEGCGAFVVYTNNATGTGPGSPTGLAERFRIDYEGKATFTNHITTPELNLPSSGMVDWGNGDARIVEGLVNNYSLSFQTYDGTNLTTALRLNGNNTAIFTNSVTATSFLGPLTGNVNGNLTGVASNLTVNANDTFSGTYPLLWHAGNVVYSSSFMTINGSTDTLSVPNISVSGDLNVDGTINLDSTVNIEGTGDALFLKQTTNAGFASIKFSDDTNDTQFGYIKYTHADVNSRGGGSSLWLTGQNDHCVVVGDGTNTGRIVVSTQNSVDEVDYGFYGDLNTGMYQPAENQVGLVVNGTRVLQATATVFHVQNVPIKTIQGTAAAPAILVGDTDSGFYDSGANQIGVSLSGVLAVDFRPTTTVFVGSGSFGGNLVVDNMLTINIDDISTGENRGLKIYNENSTGQQWNITTGITGVENTSFCIRDATNDVNAFTMAKATGETKFAGNVGIGINPVYRLHAYHPTTNVVARFESGDSNVWIDLHDNNSSTYGVLLGAEGTDFIIAPNNNEAVRIKENGRVGIGITSPTAQLQVEGGDIWMNKNNASSNYYLRLNHNNSRDGGMLWYRDNALDWQMINKGGTGDLGFYSYGISSYVVTFQKSTGRVGINTDNPSTSLEVHNTIKIGETGVTGGRLISGDSMIFQIDSDNSSGTSSYRFRCNGTEDDGTELMRLNESGRLGIGTGATIGSDIHIKRAGDAGIIIEADSDNVGENDNPTLFLRQDGGIITSRYGINGDANNQFTGAIGNAAYIHAMGAFQIAPDNGQISATFKDGAMLIDGTSGEVPSYKLDIRNASSNGINITGTGAYVRWNAGDMQIRNGGGYKMSFDTWNGTSLNEKMTISGGGTVHANTRVDVGTQTWTGYGSNPIAKLNVEVSGGRGINIYNTSENYASLSFIDSQSNGGQAATIEWSSGSGNPFKITNMGNVPIYIVDAGNVGIKKTTSISYALDVNGDIRATSDVIAFSDRRVKKDIVTVDNALNKVAKLRGVTYKRNDIPDNKTKLGVIAQEVLEVLPEVVEKDDKGMYSVAYGNMAGVFIEAIKELKAEVDSLKQEIKELKK